MRSGQAIVLVDGMNWVYRAHFANRYLTDSKGRPTSVLHAFPLMLGTMRKSLKCPVAILFDGKPTEEDGKGWRYRYPQYKAKRKKKDDVEVERCQSQLRYLNVLLHSLGYPLMRVEGLEGDDLIAVAATGFLKKGWRVYIVSNDKDFAQLSCKQLTVIRSHPTKGYLAITPSRWLQSFNVSSLEQILQKRCLVGDPSDGIPGAHGIGPVKAQKLLREGFDVLKAYDEQLPSVHALLTEKQFEEAKISYALSKLITDPTNPIISERVRAQLARRLRVFPLCGTYNDTEFRRVAFKFELHSVIRSRYSLVAEGIPGRGVNLL